MLYAAEGNLVKQPACTTRLLLSSYPWMNPTPPHVRRLLRTSEPEFSDNCDDVLEVSYMDEVEAGLRRFLDNTRTWTLDNNGNTLSAVQTVNVVDTTGPEFSAPADATIACTDDATDLSLTGNVEDAADACSNEVAVEYSDAFATSDRLLRQRHHHPCVDATDACGNSTSKEQIITLVDQNAPYFTSVPER